MVIIVFGGYQLISSLPASHSTSPRALAVSDGEGGGALTPLRFEQIYSISRRRLLQSWPLLPWYSCEC